MLKSLSNLGAMGKMGKYLLNQSEASRNSKYAAIFESAWSVPEASNILVTFSGLSVLCQAAEKYYWLPSDNLHCV